MDTSDNGDDLFGGANGELDAATWAAIVERYRRLLIVWAARCAATLASGESAEAIADQALTRAWLALSSKGFAAFPSPAAFLSYLRMCVSHAAIDAARARAAQVRTAQWLSLRKTEDPEQAVLEQLDRIELWRLVNDLVKSEQERIVLIERFVLDLPPRLILTRYPTLFADVTAVYNAVRQLCCRLQRHRELQLLWEQHIAVWSKRNRRHKLEAEGCHTGADHEAAGGG